jgi:hypothetical protein
MTIIKENFCDVGLIRRYNYLAQFDHAPVRQIGWGLMLLIFFFGLVAFLISVPVSGRAAYSLLENLAFAINMDLQGFRYIPLAIRWASPSNRQSCMNG